jgi:colicin import membrane protein
MTPEAQAEREAARKAKEAEAKAAREAAAAEAKAKKEAEDAKKRQEEAAKKASAIDEKMAAKQEDIDKIEADKARALGGKSNEALKANDIRSSEGMAQFIALATGREDPAIEENRKTNAKLEEIRKELRAMQQEKVEILGAAA